MMERKAGTGGAKAGTFGFLSRKKAKKGAKTRSDHSIQCQTWIFRLRFEAIRDSILKHSAGSGAEEGN